MSKFNVKDLNCFKQVAEVIGEARAKVELYKVMNCKTQGVLMDIDGDTIAYAFCWNYTPQGGDFWSDIASSRNPYEVEKF